MECPKCKYEPTMAENAASPEICPKCGVVYAKVQVPPESKPVGSKLAAGMAGAMAGVEAARQQREDAGAQAAAKRASPDCVVVTGVQIPFLSLIWLMTKIILAALPALILAGFIVLAITSVVGGAITGYSGYTERAARSAALVSDQVSDPGADQDVSEYEAPPAAPSRSREEVMETCKSIASFAETAIESHHRGMPLSSVLELTDSQLLSDIVMDAYSKPRYSTAEAQERAQAEFRDKYYLECMRASR